MSQNLEPQPLSDDFGDYARAPTTRETADHAELAGVIKYLRREAASNKAKRSGQACGAHFVTRARKLTQSADAIETLLSEIAALRGERDGLIEAAAARNSLLEITERQRDELRKALDRQCDNMSFVLNRVDLHTWADKFSREVAEDRALLANQGAD